MSRSELLSYPQLHFDTPSHPPESLNQFQDKPGDVDLGLGLNLLPSKDFSLYVTPPVISHQLVVTIPDYS
ncbi:MAG: hypothetical protein F6K52_08400 [Moorea sp. SIO3H5]|nr:hypothetical protein [Moorena sp. SIO3H5]